MIKALWGRYLPCAVVAYPCEGKCSIQGVMLTIPWEQASDKEKSLEAKLPDQGKKYILT